MSGNGNSSTATDHAHRVTLKQVRVAIRIALSLNAFPPATHRTYWGAGAMVKVDSINTTV